MKKLNKHQATVAYGAIITALLIAVTTDLDTIGAIVSLILLGIGLGVAIGKLLDYEEEKRW